MGKVYLSLFTGALFGVFGFFVFIYVIPDEALKFSICSGIMFALLLFLALDIIEKVTNKKYREFEKEIKSPIFYKANGNFNLGNSVRNGNIYFCEAGIVFASLDKKPLAAEELLLQNIEKYEFDNIHINVYTKDGRMFLITTSKANEIIDELKKKNWVV